MKMLTQDDFQQCFHSWKFQWDHCINAEGSYFKGEGGEQKFWYVVKLQQRYFGKFGKYLLYLVTKATVTIPP